MLSNQIINWYLENKRDLPWRKTKDPYFIWVSEIMLQQTRVATAIDYFNRFVTKFPKVSDLALANEQEILTLWQGLGYYSRARNMHHTAKIISTVYNGKFPKTYKEILQLKGIGTYTAAAIASFAYNQPFAVLDGNVFRVLARIYGADTPIDSVKGKKEFQLLANQTMGDAKPELYNQAIIEFGALQCTPRIPKCDLCPVRLHCFAANNETVDQLPIKSKQISLKNRYFYYLFISCNSRIVVEKREKNDIWKNMFQLPLIELNKPITMNELMETSDWKRLFGDEELFILSQTENKIHKLSHQNLYSTFISIKTDLDAFKSKNKTFHIIELDDYKDYPFPKLIETYLFKLTNKNSL